MKRLEMKTLKKINYVNKKQQKLKQVPNLRKEKEKKEIGVFLYRQLRYKKKNLEEDTNYSRFGTLFLFFESILLIF